ncbi:MAG: ribosome recycling factor [Candidatus Pelagibacter sp.]
MFKEDLYNQKMNKTFDIFVKELASLRTGRANASMLDLIKVDVYGQKMPINQLATITTPEPRVINIQVWDANNVPLLDSAIKKSDLGLNPQIDGQLLRLPIPDLSEERRLEIKKVIKTMGEKCKVSIRNIRREGNDELKKKLKLKEISEDDEKKFEKTIQTYTDNFVKKVDEKVTIKEKEIMTIEPYKTYGHNNGWKWSMGFKT